MPFESLIVVSIVTAVFLTFAVTLAYVSRSSD